MLNTLTFTHSAKHNPGYRETTAKKNMLFAMFKDEVHVFSCYVKTGFVKRHPKQYQLIGGTIGFGWRN